MSRPFASLLTAAAIFGATMLPAANVSAADLYQFDPTHTSVIWKAGHFGFSTPHGIFPLVEGTLSLDEETPANSVVDVTIHTAKVVTGIEKFDDHLKNADFFNVTEHPTATFKSTKVEVTGDKTAKVTGDLTLLGVTKPVTLDVTLNQKAPHPFSKKQTVGFSATGTIKRSEFGINYAIPGVPDDGELQIEAEASVEGEAAAS